jgi:hypothetical protein
MSNSINHLIVICHGLQGSSYGLTYLSNYIQNNYKNCIVLNSENNCKDAYFQKGPFKNWYNTANGIVKCAEILVSEITNFIEKEEEINKIKFENISFIGSSLGGLICRCAMGNLYSKKDKAILVATNTKYIKLNIVNYISLATPHCGLSTSLNYFKRLFIKYYYYKTGPELLLEDADLLLFQLADPNLKYYQALQQCASRITVSSLTDELVPYNSSCVITGQDGDTLKQQEIIRFLFQLEWNRIIDNTKHAEIAKLDNRDDIIKQIISYMRQP